MNEDTPLLAVLRPLLILHEGWRTKVYPDSKGIKTAGVGFNLEQTGARAICEKAGVDYDGLLAGTVELTAEQIDWILNYFITATMEWLSQLFPGFASFSVNRQAALIDMGFMGESTFKQFHGMIGAIDQGYWGTAATHALDSLWAKQVGRRAHDDAELLING
jgi:lysozyme